MKAFTIAELENLTGIKSYTIRVWEKRYRLLSPDRSESNVRSYNIEQVEDLLNVVLLNRQGYKISGLALMNSEEIKNKIAGLKAVEATYDKALKDLLLCILKTDAEDFEFILDSCAASLGMHNTITAVI
ncbi:MAG: MerR family transcriptional regulator, partial [Chitinophagaceae bacterium]